MPQQDRPRSCRVRSPLPGYILPVAALLISSLLARLLVFSTSRVAASHDATLHLLPAWADHLHDIRRLFREELDTGLPPGLIIVFKGVSIFLDERKMWRDRATKRFVEGPRKGLDGAALLFYGQKIVPVGFRNSRWRDPETG